MSLSLSHLPSKLCLRSVRSNALASSSSQQTPPCSIIAVVPCDSKFGSLVIHNANERFLTHTEKKVPLELTNGKGRIYGSSHGWVATLKDKILCLQDDLNPIASDTGPKRILLPPLVTPKEINNVAMSSSPENKNCVVAVKFVGAQLSLLQPAERKAKWINIKINMKDTSVELSQVMFSKKYNLFRILGRGGHLIGSWNTRKHKHNPKFQNLQYQNSPELTKTIRDLEGSCTMSEHLVESTTGETFLVKWYRKRVEINHTIPVLRIEEGYKTEALMVFKIDEKGNALYTQDIGDLCIFLSKSEPFCVPASSFPGMFPNHVTIYDVDEIGYVDLADGSVIGVNAIFKFPYRIPPQMH